MSQMCHSVINGVLQGCDVIVSAGRGCEATKEQEGTQVSTSDS